MSPDPSLATPKRVTNGGVVWKKGATGAGDAIPDSGMFQNPTHQWWAGAGIDVSDGSTASNWVDQLSSTTASAVNSPIYRADQGGFEAVEYSQADADGHNIPDSALPSGQTGVSFAMLVYLNSTGTGQKDILAGYGVDDTSQVIRLIHNEGQIIFDLGYEGTASGGSVPAGQWITVGGSLASDGAIASYLNGSGVGNGSGAAPNLQATNGSLSHDRIYNESPVDGFVAEAILSATDEPASAFSDYHTDRLG